MQPEISVIIPTYGREQVLLDSIDHLVGMTGPRAEIIVVDQTKRHEQGVIDRLQALASTGSIRWFRREKPGITSAMNFGAEQATFELLLFLDDDIVPDAGLFDAHIHAHQDGKGDLVAGRVLQPWHDGENTDDPFTAPSGMSVDEFIGANFSLPRSLLMDLGGFDENFKAAAYRYEREFSDRLIQAGYRIWYEPAASIRHLKWASGGTRNKGSHLTSWRPDHPVGAYYYFLVSPRVQYRFLKAARRLFKSVLTRHHLRKPWYIPVTLFSEMLGIGWAIGLRLNGQTLPFKHLHSA